MNLGGNYLSVQTIPQCLLNVHIHICAWHVWQMLSFKLSYSEFKLPLTISLGWGKPSPSMCWLRFIWHHFLWVPLTSCVWLHSSPSVLSSASWRLWAGGDDGRCASPAGGAEISPSTSCCSLRQFFLAQTTVKSKTCVKTSHFIYKKQIKQNKKSKKKSWFDLNYENYKPDF